MDSNAVVYGLFAIKEQYIATKDELVSRSSCKRRENAKGPFDARNNWTCVQAKKILTSELDTIGLPG